MVRTLRKLLFIAAVLSTIYHLALIMDTVIFDMKRMNVLMQEKFLLAMLFFAVSAIFSLVLLPRKT
jgi:hypothetical protein